MSGATGRSSTLERTGSSEADTSGTEESQQVQVKRILVVDDNRDSAMSLAMLLELRGFTVDVAHRGSEALELARTTVPDVVILDIGLPEIDGYEVARLIRQDPTLLGVVLVAVTGYGQESHRRQSAEAGFDHHLVKPVDFQALERLLAGG
jgi:CheY-like chemotaxis protein